MRTSSLAIFTLSLIAVSAESGTAYASSGHIYTSSNATNGNEVLAFRQGISGNLIPAGSFDTGGVGTGGGLGNQGAVTLSGNERWLLVVNAGSDDVSVFRVHGNDLILRDTQASGGDQPVSVTIHHRLVYVLNAGGAGSVSGFHLEDGGDLEPIAGSTRPLSGAAVTMAAQVQFSPDGSTLVVTEKATNLIVTYNVGNDGMLGDPEAHASSGMTPFGFDFAGNHRLIVSEAFGGAVDASAVSSYRVDGDGDVDVVSASVPTTETAACWIEISQNRRYAYTTNTAVEPSPVTASGSKAS